MEKKHEFDSQEEPVLFVKPLRKVIITNFGIFSKSKVGFVKKIYGT